MTTFRWWRILLFLFAALHILMPYAAANDASAISSFMLDPSFGEQGRVGIVLTQGGPDDYYVLHVVGFQADGKSVWAGRRVITLHRSEGCGDPNITKVDLFVSRYLPNGTLDTGFGQEGIMLAGLIEKGVSVATVEDVMTQPDGKILVAGTESTGEYTRSFLLLRFTTDGALDPGFGDSGILRPDFADRDLWRPTLVQQADAKIVLAGTSLANSVSGDFIVTRFLSDGTLDPRFGLRSRGIVTTNFNIRIPDREGTHATYERVNVTAMAAATDGKGDLVVAGHAVNGAITLARYTENGHLDYRFGRNGKVVTQVPQMGCIVNGIKVMPDGSIWVTGKAAMEKPSEGEADTSYPEQLLLARYTASGQPDPDFGTNGVVCTNFGGFEGIEIFPLQNGRVLVACKDRQQFRYRHESGEAGENAEVPAFACYDIRGNLIETFGENGLWRREEDGYSVFNTLLYTKMQDDGKILLAGSASSVYNFHLSDITDGPSRSAPYYLERFVPVSP